MTSAEAEPPFLRVGPAQPVSPVILSVPHAGRAYGPHLLRAARVPLSALETLEDRLADTLVWRATEAGATAFIARAPRAEIDLNRDAREIDPAMVTPPLAPDEVIQSARTRGGIGLVPTRVTGLGPIWHARLSRAELARRIGDIHAPYHDAVDAALRHARERFGAAILLDCHSMPPRTEDEANVVFGDRHGTSTTPALLEAALLAARALGYRTAVNAPYAGGYVVARHGRPMRNIHALQIEIDRAAYLDSALRAPGPGFADACRLVAAVVDALAARLLGRDLPLAAE